MAVKQTNNRQRQEGKELRELAKRERKKNRPSLAFGMVRVVAVVGVEFHLESEFAERLQ
jgi:hypothetical protein